MAERGLTPGQLATVLRAIEHLDQARLSLLDEALVLDNVIRVRNVDGELLTYLVFDKEAQDWCMTVKTS